MLTHGGERWPLTEWRDQEDEAAIGDDARPEHGLED
jgi:hypothetical protein